MDLRSALHRAESEHELATNASKYGALSNLNGHINIAWTIDGAQDNPALVLTWRESKVDIDTKRTP